MIYNFRKIPVRSINILLVLICVIAGCDFKSANDYVLDSNKLADNGKCKEAIKLLDKAIEKNPRLREAYLNKGICHEELKDFHSAINDYEGLLKIDPKNTLAFYSIGTCKYDLNLFQEAIEYYNHALETKGYKKDSDTSGQPAIIIDWNKNGIMENAKFDMESNEIFYQRAMAYYQLNKFRSAYSDFSRCLTNKFYEKECHYMIALCYLETGNKEQGCIELNKAVWLGDTIALKKRLEICEQ